MYQIILMNKKSFLLLLLVCLACTTINAQDISYSGSHRFDGTHKNEVSGYVQGGPNVVCDWFVAPAVNYKHHFNKHWSVGGATQFQFHKQQFSLAAKGTWRTSIHREYFSLYASAKLMYNYYHQWGANEWAGNLSVTWEHPYFDITVGETLMGFDISNPTLDIKIDENDPDWENFDVIEGKVHSRYFEPPTFTFGASVNIRDRNTSPWNLGLFARNYDEFFYENWNINWGLHWMARIKDTMRLYGEFNIRPAGSISQLASRYETSVKIGMKYVW